MQDAELEKWMREPYSEFMRNRGWGNYPKDDIVILCERYDISEPSLIIRLWEILEMAGSDYLAEQAHAEIAPTSKELRDQIHKISRHATTLSESISRIEKRVPENFELWRIFELADADYRMKYHSELRNSGELEDGKQALLPSLPLILNLLSYVESLCDNARKRIQDGSRGRPKPIVLRNWIDIVSRFWEIQMQRPNSIDYVNGEPVTEYCCFMRDCLAPIDQTPISAGSKVSLFAQLSKRKAQHY